MRSQQRQSVIRRQSRPAALCAVLLALGLLVAGDAATAERAVLRACADPSDMPMTNKAGEGYENKVAELFARKLGLPLEYYWVPQQMGFGRLSLTKWLDKENRYACDLVLSAGAAFDVGQATPAWFRSVYVMVFPRGQGLDSVERPDDLLALPEVKLKRLRIGGFTRSPPVTWLGRHGLLDNLVGYRIQSGGYDVDAGDIITEDLINGDLDIAMLWGPIGGYYAGKLEDANLKVVRFPTGTRLPFSFSIRMAVRHGEEEWLQTVSDLIADNRAGIEEILTGYNVPLVELTAADRSIPDDDD